jgi:hypothetical protein
MGTATARKATEHWVEPPEPALERYLLRSRRRAANDNRRKSFSTLRTVQIVACALISAVTLLGTLV